MTAPAPAPAPVQQHTQYAQSQSKAPATNPAPAAAPANLFEVEDDTATPQQGSQAGPQLASIFGEDNAPAAEGGGEDSAFGFLSEGKGASSTNETKETDGSAFGFLDGGDRGEAEKPEQKSAFAFMDGGEDNTKDDSAPSGPLAGLTIEDSADSGGKKLDAVDSLLMSSNREMPSQNQYQQGGGYYGTQGAYGQGYNGGAYGQYQQQQQHHGYHQGYNMQSQAYGGYNRGMNSMGGRGGVSGGGDVNFFMAGGAMAGNATAKQKKQASNVNMDMFTPTMNSGPSSGGGGYAPDVLIRNVSAQSRQSSTKSSKNKKQEDDSFAFVGDLMK
mmetsp:Transcript_2098/g.2985  ORF Transcript_2098/g.2985 Transcript_2098/m.2985 type:complete len:329 (-) Transcript_2098:97-1083(-)